MTHCFNGHFPGQSGSLGRPLILICFEGSLVIVMLNIFTGQAKTLHTHMVLRAVPSPFTLTATPRVLNQTFLQAGYPLCCTTKLTVKASANNSFSIK